MISRSLLVAVLIASSGSVLAAAPVPGVPGELRGHVLRADGRPVTRFTVNTIRFEDPAGAFKILVPPEGEFRIVIRADGFAPNVIHVQGAAGKKLEIPEIALGSGEDVIGDVFDAETGQAVVGARIGLADPSKIDRLRFVRPEALTNVTATGTGGAFLLPQAPRGLLMLVVEHPGYLPAFVPVNTRQRIPSIELQKAGRVSGVVRDARGVPAAGVKVVALSEAALDGGEAVADARGSFEIRGLRPGAYTVAATPSPVKAFLAPVPIAVPDGGVASVALQVNAAPAKRMELPELELQAAF
jgi:hypothetical protein